MLAPTRNRAAQKPALCRCWLRQGIRSLFVVGGIGAASVALAADRPEGAALPALLSFEGAPAGTLPAGWGGGPVGTVFLDEQVVHSGKGAARIERRADSPQEFSSLASSLPMDFKGEQVELRGFIRTEEVSDFAGLWMREDGEIANLAFENMQQRMVRGTTGWTEYAITLPVHRDGRVLIFGLLVVGTGKAWADDLQLLVDGRPIWQAPKAGRVRTILDEDHEFEAGSKVVLTEATPVQVENLATLGQVWGFLKYHHPKVTSGQRHWDYELFRVLPAVLAAKDRTSANAVLARWTADLGEIDSAGPHASLADAHLHLRPDLGWIEDESRLGPDLSARLRAIHLRRATGGGQFYVSFAPGVGNPVFGREPDYPQIKTTDAGYQLLGLYRFWNIVRYWFPYRDLVDGDWTETLAEFILRIGCAKDRETYQRELMALIARVRDTHANLWSSLQVRPPVGDCRLPIEARFVENQAVVSQLLGPPEISSSAMRVGDVIEEIDGVPVAQLVARWAPFYAASNEPTRLRDIAQALTRGPAGEVQLAVRRHGEALAVSAVRVPAASLTKLISRTHDLPGETFRLLSKEVAYLKLSSVKLEETKSYLERAAGTKGLVIDLRNYPAAFVVFALGSHLVDRPVEFARFTRGERANPGAFRFGEPVRLEPRAPRYTGKIVILVDEVSQSSAEYTAMALRVAPGAQVIGSTTAGADGNVSRVPLPGGLHAMISGIGVFYPDRRPTQRIGIIPDIEVKPTLAGIRAGCDEVLAEALRQILGPETPAEEIWRMAKRRD
ncbi:MAG: hypothetical protein HY302_12795 [Opitutae bacterium]|nr:hypothetical protein [Opitutae bacterium]